MISKTAPLGSFESYKYVVILSFYDGKILLSRHKNRRTWETQGGHVESGETPMDAAKRELYEESGALEYDMEPVFDYWAKDQESDHFAAGVVFRAEIRKLGPIPESEMAEVRCFRNLPENLTYPDISPVLFAELGVF